MTAGLEQQDELQDRLAAIIERMQHIQRAIRSSGQPAAMGELAELQKLGREYAHIIDWLANGPDGDEVA